MKKALRALVVVFPFAAISFFAASCGGTQPVTTGVNNESSTGKTGTFSVDGQSRTCNVTTQVFTTKEYSVVCQDDNYGLVQVTFKDEASARLSQSLTVIKGSISSHPDAATIVVGFLPLPGGPDGPEVHSDDGLAGTATGSAAKVTLEGVVLKSTDKSTSRTVTATINF